MTGLLQRLIEWGHAITAVSCVGRWGEIDNEHDLELCESLVAQGLLRFPRKVS